MGFVSGRRSLLYFGVRIFTDHDIHYCQLSAAHFRNLFHNGHADRHGCCRSKPHGFCDNHHHARANDAAHPEHHSLRSNCVCRRDIYHFIHLKFIRHRFEPGCYMGFIPGRRCLLCFGMRIFANFDNHYRKLFAAHFRERRFNRDPDRHSSRPPKPHRFSDNHR